VEDIVELRRFDFWENDDKVSVNAYLQIGWGVISCHSDADGDIIIILGKPRSIQATPDPD
jgi:hypothetical protein